MKRNSKEWLQKQISHCRVKHQEYSGQLEVEERKRIPNHAEMRRIKKLKLRWKDRLSEHEQRLRELTAPPRPSADVIPLPATPAKVVRETIMPRRIATG